MYFPIQKILLNHVFQLFSGFWPKILYIRKMTQKQLLRHAENSNFCEHILGYDENLLEKIEEY